MIKICPSCSGRVQAGGFCLACLKLLRTNPHPADAMTIPVLANINALYRYHGLLRSIILRAKVYNEATALKGLCELFASHPTVIEHAQSADVLVPAPSSLWGRLRGRFDLAQAMAFALGHTLGKPVELLPRRFYLRNRKRAGANAAKSSSSIKSNDLLSDYKDRQVLLIDDIFTTGFTMNSLMRLFTLSGVKKVEGIALASAWDSHI